MFVCEIESKESKRKRNVCENLCSHCHPKNKSAVVDLIEQSFFAIFPFRKSKKLNATPNILFGQKEFYFLVCLCVTNGSQCIENQNVKCGECEMKHSGYGH